MRLERWTIGLFLLLFAASCDDDKPGDEGPSASSFNKEAMLENIGNGVIIPAYAEFEASLIEFTSSFSGFASSPDQNGLDQARTSFLACRLSWQQCSPFEFGPALEESLRQTVNVFPTDTTQINDNIVAGDYNLASAQNATAIGLPAIEYLLFGPKSDALSSDVAAQTYIFDNLELLREKASQVVEGWQTSQGDYITDFKGNTSASVGSPMGQLVNELNFEFELIKNAKIGIPLGKKTLGITQAEKVEAVYSDQSLELAIANLNAVKEAFIGGDASGLDDYLDALDAQYDGGLLSDAIIDGFEECQAKLQAINGPLDEAIENSPSDVDEAHTAIQNLVVLLKTDMPSQLGVQITYQDNDGD